MVNVEDFTRRTVVLSNGVRLRPKGPIAEAQAYDNVVVVVPEWISGPRRSGIRRVRHDNVYGYDFEGRLLWRVGRAEAAPRYLYYTGLVEHAPTPTLHVATAWHATLDERTGRIVQSECVR
jgi:hypothetical protein